MTMWLAQAATETGDVSYLFWGIALLAGAIILLVLELLFPSGGLLGILCAVCTVGSIIAFWRYTPMAGGTALGIYLVLGPFVVIFGFKLWIQSSLGKRMILGGDEDAPDKSDEEAHEASERARIERMVELRQLIGANGVTITALRPVGTVKIEGKRIDALAETGVIDAQTPVVVTDVYDNQIKVRPA